MPELPEVETVRRGLLPAFEGARFKKVEIRRPDLRWPLPKDFAARLQGETVEALSRRAKYLLADLSSGDVLLMHLGMSGAFRVEKAGRQETPGEFHHPRGKLAAHDHVVFHMSNGAIVTFNDPRRFGCMKIIARAHLDDEPLLRALGPEPLGNAFGSESLAQACKNKKTSLKAALLDQCVVAGLGNIYVCEALHMAKIAPGRAGGRISRARLAALTDAIKAVLADQTKPVTITEMMTDARLASYEEEGKDGSVTVAMTNQKLSSMVKKLVDAGEVIRTEEKKKAYFSLPKAEGEPTEDGKVETE